MKFQSFFQSDNSSCKPTESWRSQEFLFACDNHLFPHKTFRDKLEMPIRGDDKDVVLFLTKMIYEISRFWEVQQTRCIGFVLTIWDCYISVSSSSLGKTLQDLHLFSTQMFVSVFRFQLEVNITLENVFCCITRDPSPNPRLYS